MSLPTTIAALCAELRARAAAGETQHTIFEYLHRVCSPLGLNLRFDEFDDVLGPAAGPAGPDSDDPDADAPPEVPALTRQASAVPGEPAVPGPSAEGAGGSGKTADALRGHVRHVENPGQLLFKCVDNHGEMIYPDPETGKMPELPLSAILPGPEKSGGAAEKPAEGAGEKPAGGAGEKKPAEGEEDTWPGGVLGISSTTPGPCGAEIDSIDYEWEATLNAMRTKIRGGGGGGGAEKPLPAGLRPFAGDADRPSVVVDDDGHVREHFDDPALRESAPRPGGHFGGLSAGTAHAGRVIVTCSRGRVLAEPALCAECNGAVFDARTWEILVVPTRAFVSRPPTRSINRALGDGHYDILQVSDGTVVNLYRWAHPVRGPIWCIATRNGYDVSHLRWMGDRTYAEILFELLGRYPLFVAAAGMTFERDFLCRGDTRLAFASLDPTRCYTVGFRCHRYHPLLQDPEAVWNMQTADLSEAAPAVTYGHGLFGVPDQLVYTAADVNKLLGMAAGARLRHGDLCRFGETSLADATAAIAAGAAPAPAGELRAGVHATAFNYGFILRANAAAAAAAAHPVLDVLCDTPLLRNVRRLVYQRPPLRIRQELNEHTRLEYYAIGAFLSATARDLFLRLFPHFAPRFGAYQTFVDNVVTLVNHMRRQDAMAPNAAPVEAATPSTPTKTVARALFSAIARARGQNFAPFGSDAASIVHDLVCAPEYALVYLRAIGPRVP